MMRIAIAGGGGFSFILAQYITQNASPVLIISQSPHPEFEQSFPGCQTTLANFSSIEDLQYALQGVDILISTVLGNEQINLISAACGARVRFFVPSEFEGDLAHRPGPHAHDPLDRGSGAALRFLEQLRQQQQQQGDSNAMRYTVFSCGIFMERFCPGGLRAYNIGAGSGLQAEDDYLVNVGGAVAETVDRDAQGSPAYVSLTSVYDVAHFLAAAIELGPASWPREFRMRGDHMLVSDVVATCAGVRGVSFSVAQRTYQDALAQAQASLSIQNVERWLYYQRLLQTANGRYNIRQPNLNPLVQQNPLLRFQPMTFRDWLVRYWGPAV